MKYKFEEISMTKKIFEELFLKELDLELIDGPLFLRDDIGVNNDLSGETPVKFSLMNDKKEYSIAHSLAKWKRIALSKLGFEDGRGIFVRMFAIRREEKISWKHSNYVDQFDWEKVISKEDRTKEYLRNTVKKIVKVISDTENEVSKLIGLKPYINRNVKFITSSDLLEVLLE